jgi:hypothetical protein
MISIRRCIIFIFLYSNVLSISGAYADEPKLFSIHYDTLSNLNKIAIIIPGKNQGLSSPGYCSIGGFYKSKGICPVYVNVCWGAMGIVGINKLSVIAQQIGSMLKDSFPHSHIYLFGFSFGAVISLKLAQQRAAEHVLLCSMSPVFFEDWKCLTFPQKQFLGMFSDFSTNNLSYSMRIDNCVYFLYGDHDTHIITKDIIKRRQTTFRCNETIMVKDGRHDISGQTYQTAIETIVKRIPDDSTAWR